MGAGDGGVNPDEVWSRADSQGLGEARRPAGARRPSLMHEEGEHARARLPRQLALG